MLVRRRDESVGVRISFVISNFFMRWVDKFSAAEVPRVSFSHGSLSGTSVGLIKERVYEDPGNNTSENKYCLRNSNLPVFS